MPQIITEAAAKAKAKALRLKLNSMGFAIGHQQALEVVASLENETGWSSLNAKQNQAAAPKFRLAPTTDEMRVSPSYGSLDDEPMDPALAEFDYTFAISYELHAPGKTPTAFELQPYKYVRGAIQERDRVRKNVAEHHTIAVICCREVGQGWRPMPADEIERALTWETRHNKKENSK